MESIAKYKLIETCRPSVGGWIHEKNTQRRTKTNTVHDDRRLEAEEKGEKRKGTLKTLHPHDVIAHEHTYICTHHIVI